MLHKENKNPFRGTLPLWFLKSPLSATEGPETFTARSQGRPKPCTFEALSSQIQQWCQYYNNIIFELLITRHMLHNSYIGASFNSHFTAVVPCPGMHLYVSLCIPATQLISCCPIVLQRIPGCLIIYRNPYTDTHTYAFMVHTIKSISILSASPHSLSECYTCSNLELHNASYYLAIQWHCCSTAVTLYTSSILICPHSILTIKL